MSGLLERFAGSPLRPIAGKVAEGRRLSFEDGVALFGSPDVLGVGALANFVRERKHGNTGYYNVNRYLNPTNLCWVDCALCAWARKPGVDGGYTMSIEEAVAESELRRLCELCRDEGARADRRLRVRRRL